MDTYLDTKLVTIDVKRGELRIAMLDTHTWFTKEEAGAIATAIEQAIQEMDMRAEDDEIDINEALLMARLRKEKESCG